MIVSAHLFKQITLTIYPSYQICSYKYPYSTSFMLDFGLPPKKKYNQPFFISIQYITFHNMFKIKKNFYPSQKY